MSTMVTMLVCIVGLFLVALFLLILLYKVFVEPFTSK